MVLQGEALAIVIDVSPRMADTNTGKQSLLQKSITAANMIVQRKIFADTKKNKDEATLILFGTNGGGSPKMITLKECSKKVITTVLDAQFQCYMLNFYTHNNIRFYVQSIRFRFKEYKQLVTKKSTSNPLNDGANEGYKHITLAQELRVMDLDLLKFINNQIVPGNSDADFIDALVVAVDHLRTKCLGRKFDKKVILFSDMSSEFGVDQLDMIISAIKTCEINLIFVGPEIDDAQNSERPELNHRPANKPLGPQQVKGINCIRHILDSVDGEGLSISEVLPMLSFFEKRRKNQVTTFRGPIEIGESLKINVHAFVKTLEEKPYSWKKLSALAESAANCDTMEVEVHRSYHRIDEDQTEVDKENIAQAYRYGKMLVPMSAEDQKAMKLKTERGCLVLGFTSRDKIERWMFSRNGCHLFVAQPDDEHAAVAFSALCRALEEKNMVAIVRYIPRSNTDPKIGFLTPHIKSTYESLLFIALPFKEDIRHHQFPSLNNVKEPSAEVVAAMDSFIDSMTLMKNDFEDDEPKELFNPKDLLNPYMQRQFQCIQSRALNPDEVTIPEVEEYIASSLRVLPEMLAKAQAQAKLIKESFPLKAVEKKNTNVNIFQQGIKAIETQNKNSEDDNNEAIDFASLSKSRLTEVGTADPVNDFLILIEKADDVKFVEVCEQMRKCILKLVLSSILSQYFSKAFLATKALREHSVAKRISKVFNALLCDLKEETRGKRKDEFWQLIIKENLAPISKTEAEDSSFTEDQVNQFFATSGVEEEIKIDQMHDDADELLDMM